MIIALSILLFTSRLPAEASRMLSQAGFILDDLKFEYETGGYKYVYRNPTNKSSIFISANQTDADGSVRFVQKIDSLSARVMPGRESYAHLQSNLPFGSNLRADSGSGSVHIGVTSDLFLVHLRMGSGGRKSGGTVVWENANPAKDKSLCEGLARWILAVETGKRMVSMDTTFSNRTYFGLKHPSGETQIPLSQWAGHAGYQVQLNRDMGRAYVTGPKGTLLIPLGADRIKVADRWIKIKGVVAARNSEMMVPIPILQHLASGQ